MLMPLLLIFQNIKFGVGHTPWRLTPLYAGANCHYHSHSQILNMTDQHDTDNETPVWSVNGWRFSRFPAVFDQVPFSLTTSKFPIKKKKEI